MTKNIIFFGSPSFSANILDSICKLKIENCKFRVIAAVTSPDRPTGRHQTLTPSPVALIGGKYNLPIFKPEKLDSANLSHLKLLKPDFFLVVSYGKIIPKEWLEAAKTLNVHFSLLPKYRGALCIQEALKNGDHETGVTLMEMVEKLDAGPIISQKKIKIDLSDDVASLTTKLTHEAVSVITNEMQDYFDGKIKPIPQNEQQVVLTPSTKSLTRSSAFIPWEILSPFVIPSEAKNIISEVERSLHSSRDDTALKLHNKIRSLNPDPGAWTHIPVNSDQSTENSKIELKIIKTSLTPDLCTLTPELVQLPGKSPISWQSFLSGHPEVNLT